MVRTAAALLVVAFLQTSPAPRYRSTINLVFLSFPHGTEGHNDRTLRVQLRLIAMPGNEAAAVSPRTLVEVTGGQGTINVNSWSPDSTRFAYVGYETHR